MQLEGWNIIDRDAAVLWREYTFSKNAYATTPGHGPAVEGGDVAEQMRMQLRRL